MSENSCAVDKDSSGCLTCTRSNKTEGSKTESVDVPQKPTL